MKLLPIKATQFIGRKILVAKKQSPHIFFVAGVISAVASTVLACRATLKLSDTLDDIQKDINDHKKLKELVPPGNEYPMEQYNRDEIYLYVRGGVKLTKLYGPSVILGVAAIGLLTGSHIQLTRRNAALMAAYAALQKAFEEYRERVQAEVGEEKENDLYHNLSTIEITDENGKKTEIKVANDSKWSVYAKFFDEGSRHWQKDPEFNRFYLQAQQNYANDLLRSRGHVFLNEVYDMLDVERTKAGQMVGWVLNDEGDNYVSFGIFATDNSRFVNGVERSILLDFNVDGVIFDKL